MRIKLHTDVALTTGYTGIVCSNNLEREIVIKLFKKTIK